VEANPLRLAQQGYEQSVSRISCQREQSERVRSFARTPDELIRKKKVCEQTNLRIMLLYPMLPLKGSSYPKQIHNLTIVNPRSNRVSYLFQNQLSPTSLQSKMEMKKTTEVHN